MHSRMLGIICCLLAWTSLAVGEGKGGLAEKPFIPPKRWALVVGASEYKSLGRLNYAVDDAKAFAKTLVDRYSFQPDTVDLITDDAASKEKPDGATIKAALARQIADKRLEKGDLFIFFFAGHGIGTPTGDYILPTDATKENATTVGQPVREIVNLFVEAGLKNVLVIVDACRAGEENNTFGAELQELGRKANIAVMLGCAPGSRSYEYPQLGHGVFTHFLLKSLANRELCSPESGTLWASRVADDVRAKVSEYTLRDYPTKPQTPERWTDATRDVMLGAFLSKSKFGSERSSFMKEAEKLDQEAYANALDQYACDLYVANRHKDATELYKTLESLEKLTPASRYLFGMSLDELGRYGESEREFGLIAEGESPLYKQLSILFSPSRKITPEARKKAAEEAWKLEPKQWVGLVIWSSFQVYGSQSDLASFLQEFLKLPDLDERNREFFQGIYAMSKSDWQEALLRFDNAAKLPGDLPQADVIESMRYVTLTYLGRLDALVANLKRLSDDPVYGPRWNLLLADYYDEVGKTDEKMAATKKALNQNANPEDLLHALRLSGLRYVEITDLIRKRAKEFPYSWKAIVANIWADALSKGQGAIQGAIQEALKYCDDEFGVLYELFRILDRQSDEMLEQGRLSPQMYTSFQVAYSTIMAASIDELGYDPEAWTLLTKFAFAAQKYEQMLALYEYRFGAQADSGALDPKLRAHFLFVAMAMGDEARMERLWKLGHMHPSDQVDGGWVRAIFLALRGKVAESKAAIPTSKPSRPYRPVAEAFLAYLDVLAGKKIDLHALTARLKSDPWAMQLIALSYARLGKWEAAEPLFKSYGFSGAMNMTFLQAKALEVYLNRLLQTKRYAEANDLAFNVMISDYGNPLYSHIHFGPKVDVSQFAGRTSFEPRRSRACRKSRTEG